MAELNKLQEYLKRYIDSGSSGPKKKKLKPKSSRKQSRFKIVDEDIDISKIEVPNNEDEVGDEAPLVVDVIDERPDHVKISEIYSCSRWRKLDNSVAGGEASLSPSYSGSKDSSEQKFFSNRKGRDIQLRPQERQTSPDHEQSKSRTTKFHSKCNRDRATYPVAEHVKGAAHSQKSSCFSPDMSRVEETRDSHTNASPPTDVSKESHSAGFSKKNNKSAIRHDSDSGDLSPVRRSELSSEILEHSPSNIKRLEGDDDLSPPRRSSSTLSSKVVQNLPERKSPPKKRHDSDSDISPPRTKINDSSDSDLSPPRNAKHPSESPRSSKNAKVQNSSDSDLSPPRVRRTSTSNASKRSDSDCGAEIKKMQSLHSGRNKSSQHPSSEKRHSRSVRRRHDSDEGDSSSRDRHQNSSERQSVLLSSSHSPKNKGKSHRKEEKDHQALEFGDSDKKRMRPTSTLSGMKAGLQDSSALREETRNLKEREQAAINKLSDDLSGRNAETVVRDRDTGCRRNLKEEKLRQKEEEKKNAEKQEKYLEWGKGLKQKGDQQKKLQEDMYEMSKPLARYATDEDLETNLKNAMREGDPMSAYIIKKTQKNLPATASFPVYEGPPAPPNRFNITPGYRWDGVDRSNGFEKRYFEKVSSTKAKQDEAYLWSVQNM